MRGLELANIVVSGSNDTAAGDDDAVAQVPVSGRTRHARRKASSSTAALREESEADAANADESTAGAERVSGSAAAATHTDRTARPQYVQLQQPCAVTDLDADDTQLSLLEALVVPPGVLELIVVYLCGENAARLSLPPRPTAPSEGAAGVKRACADETVLAARTRRRV